MTDHNIGLTTAEANRRAAAGMSNATEKHTSKTVGQIIRSNTLTAFNILFFFFAILVITTGSFNNLTFIIVVIVNTVIGILQELNSKRVLDNLAVLTAPHSNVIRDGKLQRVETESLVKGDICEFTTGDQISADAVVVAGEMKVNEALVTGESDEIVKKPGDKLLSGSFVISGTCIAELTDVGEHSYVNRLTKEAKASKGKSSTEMMNSLSKLIKLISIFMVPIGVAMFLLDMFVLNIGYVGTINSVVASLVGMIPEGLYLLTSIALTASVAKLGVQKVLVQEMASVETLARVNVLCLDKTGTLTENEMAFEALIPLDGYDETNADQATLTDMLENFVGEMSNDNVTMATLKKTFGRHQGHSKAVRLFPFSSLVKYSAVQFAEGTYVLGAPEKLLLDRYPEYDDQIKRYMNVGNRVLLFGYIPEEDGVVEDGKPLSKPVVPLGLVLLTNPVRKTAKKTIKFFQEQGVEVKVISGDNPATVAAVAKKVGIKNADEYVDASTLQTDTDIYRAVRKYTVFGRVAPSQKRKIVEALQLDEKVVAMTGDGVNDVLALKKADCSIAIGEGSDVVSKVSQIVLLDADFSRMESVVSEGRQVVNNIQRSASLFLNKNIYSFLTAILVMIIGSVTPIYPTQMSYLSLVTIGIPGFFLSMEPNNELIKGNFLKTILRRAMPAGFTNFVIVSIVTIVAKVTNINFNQSSTMSILLLLFVGVLMLYKICTPFSKYRLFIWCLTIFCSIGGMIILPGLFEIHPIEGWQIIWVIALAVGAVFLYQIFYKLEEKLMNAFVKKVRKNGGNNWLGKIMRRIGLV